MKKLIVGNWKMNPSTVLEARTIIRKTRAISGRLMRTEVVVCPPNPFISLAVSRRASKNYAVGAQSVSIHEGGAYTGEVGASMFKDLGVEYVIVGHSETRFSDKNPHGDRDEIVGSRIARILDAGLTAIVCIGEAVRDEHGSHFESIKDQMKKTLAGVSSVKTKHIIIAYEPIWAIGAPEPMRPEDIHEMCIFIKKVFADMFGHDVAGKARVLYGGAVNFRNAADSIRIGGVDGLLVGRESVNIPGFVQLLKSVDEIK